MKNQKAKSNHAQVAAALKKYAKGLGVANVSAKSSSYSGGSSVTVYVSDLPPAVRKDLEAEGERYVYGHFDGMQDMYEYKKDREDLPMVSYVFIENEMSDAMKQQVYEFAKGFYAGFEDAPANYADAYNFNNQNLCEYASTIVFRLFSGYFSYYWDSVEEAKEAAELAPVVSAANKIIASAMAM